MSVAQQRKQLAAFLFVVIVAIVAVALYDDKERTQLEGRVVTIERVIQGTPGATGKAGTAGVAAEARRGLAGATGAQGSPGTPGRSIKGSEGDPGDAGQDGAQGSRGPQGERGPAGARGPQGAQGPAGVVNVDLVVERVLDRAVPQILDRVCNTTGLLCR